MNEKIKLYWTRGSIYSWRVHLYLEHRKIPYELFPINISKGENKTPEFLKLNPRGRVPVLVDGNTIIYESLAIIHYLEYKFRNVSSLPKVFPENLENYAKVLTRAYDISENLPIREFFCPLVHDKPESWNISEMGTAWDKIFIELQRYNSWLETTKFIATDEFSFADCVLIPFLGVMIHNGADFKGMRLLNLNDYYHRISEMETFKNTFPPHYKESTRTSKIPDFLFRYESAEDKFSYP